MKGLFSDCVSLCLHPVHVFKLPAAVLMTTNMIERNMSSSGSPKWHSAHNKITSASVALGGTDECPFTFGEHLFLFMV